MQRCRLYSTITFLFVFSTLGFLMHHNATAAQVACDAQVDSKGYKDESRNANYWPGGFRPKAGMCVYGYIVGKIERGDYDKVHDLIEQNYPFIWGFYLRSEGGDVEEAMKIGRLFRKLLLKAIAPSKLMGMTMMMFPEKADCPEGASESETSCICASACSLIWFGAVERQGRVAVHRPSTTSEIFRNATAATAQKLYQDELASISSYLDEMEIQRSVEEILLSTESSKIRWIEEKGLERSRSFAEWEDANCGILTEEESAAKAQLEARSDRRDKISLSDKVALNLLKTKYYKIDECKFTLITSNKEKISQKR